MRKYKFPLKRKIDFLFVFIIVFTVVSSFYAYKYLSSITAASDHSFVSIQIKEKLSDLNQQLKNTHFELSEKPNRDTDKLQRYYINQFESLDKDFSSLELLLPKNNNSKKEFQTTRTLFVKYFKTIEFNNASIVFSKESVTNRENLLAEIHDRIANLQSGVDQNLRSNSAKIDLIKKDGYVVAATLILALLLVGTGFYLKIRYDVKVCDKKEIELINKLEELELINKNNKRLFSVIAHDLRSPFHPILMIAEILMTGGDEVEKEEIIELGLKLKTTGDNVLSLLDNLLAWSRVRSGTLQIKSELFSLRDTVNEALTNLRMEAEKKEISDYNEVSENLWIITDHRILLLLLQNLISNAIKFTNKGGKIRITGKMENNNIHISVIDNGIGIAPEIAKNIFSTSFNQTALGTNNEKGSGLGLIFCKEYIELHSGKIWVESQPEKGSTFSFTLPVKALSNDGDLFTCYKVKHAATSTNVGKNLISVRA